MKTFRGNDKERQLLPTSAMGDVQQTIRELHGLLARPGRAGLSVGEMVSVAASMGLLTCKSGALYHS
jgi:hypothetical protein